MRDLRAIANQTYDLIVIGGGINGAGVVRDAALRGLKALLIDKGDFCGGATSWSTRLVHGGLRYLEYFEVNLVRESLREREILLHTAPHLVKPLLLTIPIYRDRSRPYWKVQAGMTLYDVLSYDKTLPNHRMLPSATCQQLFREIEPENLAGAAQYYDAQVAHAERLSLENVLDAEAAGAAVLNYAEAIELHLENQQVTHLTCRDQVSGEQFIVKCGPQSLVVNTAGPWVDAVLQRGRKGKENYAISDAPKIGPTKGSHIVVEPFPGMPMDSALYVEAKSDGRPFFIVPWLGKVLIGTTDLRYSDSLSRIKANDNEIDYLIKETNLIIPTAQLSRASIKFTYSGVRPLPAAQPGQKTSSITRSHVLYDHAEDGAGNLISLIGGKITTYRQVGEEVVDQVYARREQKAPECPTKHRPLPGAVHPNDVRIQAAIGQYQNRISLESIDHLFGLYGARATEILQLVDQSPELAERIDPNQPSIRAQIVFAVQSEYAETILDIIHRRTMLAMSTDYGYPILPLLKQTLNRYCGWDQARCDRAAEQYQQFMRENCIPDFALDDYQSRDRNLMANA
ncbi:glycerol-3-phosphate dehydrogenase/oxidase [filamentous cyanobacterium LEGE 11480]|uniref:Glycerol-3-phosphate dehydrogenase/oxidase n=1 Tax=Romeriopsis navalis LEGE 11480 TaxID=2777977 RepID=A0A928Z5C2_9CYAN|nr:glycerol-3-phosphate dehydrogenase/oxidase [Romeriopsis navalis]MBE9031323.1 glycerol-3-phosphate dehydrogenase/oxidase [Romeriopsis navalis LEGE 11480]